jgi:membrane-associated phospholipid phosphatase
MNMHKIIYLMVGLSLMVSTKVFAYDGDEKVGDILAKVLGGVAISSVVVYEDGFEGIMQFGMVYLGAQGTTSGLKLLTRKKRPNGGCCKSFPSGHATSAFASAAFIHGRYGIEFGIPAYLAATYVARSRVQAKKHYVEDVIAGAAVGYLFNSYITTKYKKNITVDVKDDSYSLKYMLKF